MYLSGASGWTEVDGNEGGSMARRGRQGTTGDGVVTVGEYTIGALGWLIGGKGRVMREEGEEVVDGAKRVAGDNSYWERRKVVLGRVQRGGGGGVLWRGGEGSGRKIITQWQYCNLNLTRL